MCDVFKCIKSDLRKLFDSTLEMFSTIFQKEETLRHLQNSALEGYKQRLLRLHFSADDLGLIESVITILEPVRNVTRAHCTTNSWIGDVLPLMTSAIDSVRRVDVTSDAECLNNDLVDTLALRVQMLLGVDENFKLPCVGGRRMGSRAPTGICTATYLNPRFSKAIYA